MLNDNISKNVEIKNSILGILDNSRKNRIIFLIILGVFGLGIRFYYFPFDVPLFNDAGQYFWYAIEINLLNHLPYTSNAIQYDNGQFGHAISNNGWPIFVSIFFRFFDSQNFLDYHNLQRLIGLLLSVLTIIPVYLLCSKFFKKSYSLIASSLFLFEPRLVQNSILGTPESLYIFLMATSLVLFLSSNLKKIYLSFIIIALLSIVRYEGTLMIIPFTIVFFIRFRKQKKDLVKYLICLSFFILIMAPMGYLKNETMGYDGFTSHISAGPDYYQKTIQNDSSALMDFIYLGILNLTKYLGWSLIPIFILFIPVGIFCIFRNIDYKKIIIILTVITMLIPAFYGYSRELQEMKYIFVLYPIFCIFAGYTIKLFFEKTNKKNLIICLLFAALVLSSIMYLEWKDVDQNHYRETFEILTQISQDPIKINSDFATYGGEYTYFHWVTVENAEKFPLLKKELPRSNIDVVKKQDRLLRQIEAEENKELLKNSDEYLSKTDNLEDYFKILEKQKVSHLLLDEAVNSRLTSDDLRIHLRDIFKNEKDYPYLFKVYDSKDVGFNYQLKLFEIDYNAYKKMQNND